MKKFIKIIFFLTHQFIIYPKEQTMLTESLFSHSVIVLKFS
jgi:hypothetical protein